MPTANEISLFETLNPKMVSVRDTFKSLSSKKTDETLNRFKIERINILLRESNHLLGKLRPYDDFEEFDMDNMPTNSDVLMILELYLDAFHRYRIENTREELLSREWNVIDND